MRLYDRVEEISQAVSAQKPKNTLHPRPEGAGLSVSGFGK
jgi:hypothetical protein